jgi:hypothetical protein
LKGGWRREAGTLYCQPFPEDRHFVERKLSRRTHEVVAPGRVDRTACYCEPTQHDFITDQRPPSKRESLTSCGRTYDSDRVIECRARAQTSPAPPSNSQAVHGSYGL